MKYKDRLHDAICWINYHITNAVGALITSESDRAIDALESEISALECAMEVLKEKYEDEP